MPALPLDEAGKYVAAAYLVFLALILIYVAIMAGRLSRIEKDLQEVTELLERRTDEDREPVAGIPTPIQRGGQPHQQGEAVDILAG